MTRDGGEGQTDLDTLWTMPKHTGRGASGQMFQDRYGVELTRRPQMIKSAQNKLLNHIRSDQKYNMKVANFPGFHEQVTKLHITEEIAYRTMSNSEPCENVICKASLTLRGEAQPSREVTMKFRKAQLDTVTLTEKEMRKAALIQENSVVRAMFPSVYFVCVLTWEERGSTEYWEGVAMESLIPVTQGMIELKHFNHDAATMLRRIHREGFIHGDPHSGNFMIRAELAHQNRSVAAGGTSSGASGAHVSQILVPIDFDMIRPLPQTYYSDADYNRVDTHPVSEDDADAFRSYLYRLSTKVMVIYDYNKLLFCNNFYCKFMNRRDEDPQLTQETDQFYMDMSRKNEASTPSILFMPWPYAFNWEKDHFWSPATLHATLKANSPHLLRHIDGISVADIDFFYMTLFSFRGGDEDDEETILYYQLQSLDVTIEEAFKEWKRDRAR